MEIVFTSPAAHAQYASGVGNISGFLQDIAPMIPHKPELLENIEANEMFNELARMRNVSRKIIVSKEKVEEKVAAQQEQQMQEQQMQQLPQMAGAMKDVAQARSSDPEGMGELLNM